MSKEEHNYEIYDREMLGCIRAFEDWRHFLEGICYRPQEYRMVGNNARFKSTTSKVVTLPKSFQFQSNLLQRGINASRCIKLFFKDHVSDRDDNRQVQVLGPQHFLNTARVHFCPEIDSLGDCIRWASLREAEVIEGLKSIDKTAPKALTNGVAMWEEDDGFVYYKG
jgi:hypothetical protein